MGIVVRASFFSSVTMVLKAASLWSDPLLWRVQLFNITFGAHVLAVAAAGLSNENTDDIVLSSIAGCRHVQLSSAAMWSCVLFLLSPSFCSRSIKAWHVPYDEYAVLCRQHVAMTGKSQKHLVDFLSA